MKKQVLAGILALSMATCMAPATAFAAEGDTAGAEAPVTQQATTIPNQDLVMSAATKAAINTYIANPTEANKQAIFDAMNANYTAKIGYIKSGLELFTTNQDAHITQWLAEIQTSSINKKGIAKIKLPSKVKKPISGTEEQAAAVEAAARTYVADRTEENLAAVKTALESFCTTYIQVRTAYLTDITANQQANVEAAFNAVIDGIANGSYVVTPSKEDKAVTTSFKMNVKSNSLKKGGVAVVTVTASSDVASVQINGEDATKTSVKSNGKTSTWTGSVTYTVAGSYTITATGFNVDGTQVATSSRTINVK